MGTEKVLEQTQLLTSCTEFKTALKSSQKKNSRRVLKVGTILLNQCVSACGSYQAHKKITACQKSKTVCENNTEK